MQACKLRLPLPPPSSFLLPSLTSSPSITSALFDSSSNSLALMHSDSSVLLYSSLPLPSSTPPPPPTLIPPVSSAASFLRLLPTPHLLFFTTSPSPSGTLLRAWIRCQNTFLPKKLTFREEKDKFGVVVPLRHGFGVRIAGSVNFFALHSPADGEIWVFGARMGKEDCLELVKCAVISCVSPVYDVKVFSGFLFLGELGGVRVFPMRVLAKGKVRSASSGGEKARRKGEGRMHEMKKKLPNGMVLGVFGGGRNCASSAGGKCNEERRMVEQSSKVLTDDCGDMTVTEEQAATKLRVVKVSQNSSDLGSIFVEFKSTKVQIPGNKTGIMTSLKAVAVHALSLKKFLILDSVGNVHLLNMRHAVLDTEAKSHTFLPSLSAQIRLLDYKLDVQMLSVHPDTSSGKQVVWMSDASHSLHMTSLDDMVNAVDENNSDDSRENLKEITATEAVFTSEKIHDLVPVSANAVLIVGQENMFVYAAA